MKFLFYLVILCGFLFSCQDSDNEMARAWIYHDWTIEEEAEYRKQYKRKPALEFTSGNFIDHQ